MTSSIKGVAFGALNYRMGGQLSSLIALADELQAMGVRARVLLPAGTRDFSKEALSIFSRQSLGVRLESIYRMLREQAQRRDELFHLILPTPGFAGIARALGFRTDRTLLQWEGRPLAFDRETLSALKDDPGYLLPRLLFNHQRLHCIARLCNYHQLVTTPYFAQWLRLRGHRGVSCIANFAALSRDDLLLPAGELQRFLDDRSPLIGYIGHAHRVKGVNDLLDAFLLAKTYRPELRLLLALSVDGNGQDIVRRVDALPEPIRSKIFVTGTVPVGVVLGRLDALVLPYRTIVSTTLLPSLLLEAGQEKCPVIISDLPDFSDIIPFSGDGWYPVPPGNVEMLTKAIVSLPERKKQTALNIAPAAIRIAQLIEVYAKVSGVDLRDVNG